jgi:hypothetical protein
VLQMIREDRRQTEPHTLEGALNWDVRCPKQANKAKQGHPPKPKQRTGVAKQSREWQGRCGGKAGSPSVRCLRLCGCLTGRGRQEPSPNPEAPTPPRPPRLGRVLDQQLIIGRPLSVIKRDSDGQPNPKPVAFAPAPGGGGVLDQFACLT